MGKILWNSHRASYDLWADLPSPIKTTFRNSCYEQIKKLYQQTGYKYQAYIPAEPAGGADAEDMIMNMPLQKIPGAYLAMGFGECAHRKFKDRLLVPEAYCHRENYAYFPEVMVIDKKRLGKRKLPETYEALTDVSYRGEICLIGQMDDMDPLIPVYLYRKFGEKAVRAFVENINCCAAPIETIRHIGKAGNTYGSVFVMPYLFAQICLENPYARVQIAADGAAAENFILFCTKEAYRQGCTKNILNQAPVRRVFEEKYFPLCDSPMLKIDSACKDRVICEELARVRTIIRDTRKRQERFSKDAADDPVFRRKTS